MLLRCVVTNLFVNAIARSHFLSHKFSFLIDQFDCCTFYFLCAVILTTYITQNIPTIFPTKTRNCGGTNKKFKKLTAGQIYK